MFASVLLWWGSNTRWKTWIKFFIWKLFEPYWLMILTNWTHFIRLRTMPDYCSTNGIWRPMISYFPMVLLIILGNQSHTANRTSHANLTDLLEAGTCFYHSLLVLWMEEVKDLVVWLGRLVKRGRQFVNVFGQHYQ